MAETMTNPVYVGPMRCCGKVHGGWESPCPNAPDVPPAPAPSALHEHAYDSTGHCTVCGTPRCPNCGRSEEQHDGTELHGCIVFWGIEPAEEWHYRNEQAKASRSSPMRETCVARMGLNGPCGHPEDAPVHQPGNPQTHHFIGRGTFAPSWAGTPGLDAVTDDDVRRAICNFNGWLADEMADRLSDVHVQRDTIAVGLRRALTGFLVSRDWRIAALNSRRLAAEQERNALRATIEQWHETRDRLTGGRPS